jgi:hypothetical protein
MRGGRLSDATRARAKLLSMGCMLERLRETTWAAKVSYTLQSAGLKFVLCSSQLPPTMCGRVIQQPLGSSPRHR